MATEAVFTRADLLAAEKQQLRLLIEQQHNNPHLHQQQSSYTSYAPPFPIISLADDWHRDASPLPPTTSSAVSSLPSSDDFFSNYLNDDVHSNSGKHYPSSSFSNFSVTSDYYNTHPSPSPSPSPPSPSSSYNDKLTYDQPFTTSLKRSHNQLTTADELPPTKRLTVELPSSAYSQFNKKAGGQQSAMIQAQYPLLSSELVDGFFASNVNVSNGVMGGLDDSELGLTFSSMSRQASEESNIEKAQLSQQLQLQAEPQVTLPAQEITPQLPRLSLEPQTSQQSVVSNSSSTAPSIPFVTSSISSVLSTFSSSASSPFDNPSSLSNLTNRLLPPDVRRARVSDV